MARPQRWLTTTALAALAVSRAAGAADLSRSATATTDIYTESGAGPEALQDGDDATMFRMHRVFDSDWRVTFAGPAVVNEVIVVQAWDNWSLPEELQLESADGTVVTIPLDTSTREPQAFTLDFPWPTAFIDVRVSRAQAAADGGTFGGLAELRFEGTPAGTDARAPAVSGFSVARSDPNTAVLTFTTDEPAACRVRYSQESAVSTLSPHTLDLRTEHSIDLFADSPLGGQVEVRCADAAGNRAEVRQDAFTTIDTSRLEWGMGGWAFEFDGEWVRAADRFAQDGLVVDFSQIWTDRSFDSTHIKPEDIKQVHEDGLLPEIIHFWVGASSPEEMTREHDNYLADVTILAENIRDSGVGEEVLVTLEPEYNQGEMAEWDGWNDLMIEAITILHEVAGAKVGLLPGPWDIDHKVPLSMGRAVAHADFVALQSMAGSVTNTREEMAVRVDETLKFTRYLNRRFLKPVRLGYLMISDYGDWADVQRDVMIEYCERLPELEAAGLVSLAWMGYVDHPGATGALGKAEAHKGLLYSNGDAKPAFAVFQECAQHGASWLATGAEPPGEVPEKKDAGCGCRATTGSTDAGLGSWGWLGALALLRLRRARPRSRL